MPSDGIVGTMPNETSFTVTELAKSWRVSRSKVLHWIHSGELVAWNTGEGSTPRYRISQEAAKDFRESRTQAQRIAKRKRRVKPSQIKEFF